MLAPLAAKAKSVIFLFMYGGPSHVDTFDYKPLLETKDGQKLPFDDPRTVANTGSRGTDQRVLKSPWKFRNYGQSGIPVSDLFPHLRQCMDDICLVKSMKSDDNEHYQATLGIHTATKLSTRARAAT